MNFIYTLLTFTVIFKSFTTGSECKGCLPLDEHNFDKVIPKFKVAVVKFDISYPYGDKQNVYEKFSEEMTAVKDVIIAEVGIQDYGDQKNQALAKKYGITKDDFPVVLLFLEGKKDPIPFATKENWLVDDFKLFIKENTNIYIGLPGCIEQYDKLAIEFITASDKPNKLKQAEKMLENEKDERTTAKTYVNYMKKVIEQGVSFIKQEVTRLNKIITEGKVNKKKKEELSQRLNILHSFAISVKDEL